MASIPGRRRNLERVVARILPQVDRLCVYLNGWDDVPEVLRHPRVRVARSQDHGDLRDSGKFFFDVPDGYHVTLDDDLLYPVDHVEHLVAKIEQFDRTAVVGVHGVILQEPVREYFDEDAREGFHFSTGLRTDRVVHVLGTGTVAMHTDTIRVTLDDMVEPGMADIWLAVAAHRRGIPLVAIARPRRHLASLPREGPTLFEEFRDDDRRHVDALASVRLQRPDLFAGVGSG